ncbi:MAG TPA: EAL domain-containing protein [Jatrophihabitans sp.]
MSRRLPSVTDARPQRAAAAAPVRPTDVRIALQPIIAVPTGAVFAVEALARIADRANTEAVFRDAHDAGRGAELEAWCLQAALARRADLPPGALLSVNVSPTALPHLVEHHIWPADLTGVIVEITEQEVVDAGVVNGYLELLRVRGAAIAIDDVSTGYAGLLRLAQMAPDYVKVDRQVVTGVAADAIQAAVLEALVTLSHRLGAKVIGEGVESFADLAALGDYDVDYAQGFAIGRPSGAVAVTPDIVAACRANRRRLLGGVGTSTREVTRTRDLYAVTAALASADRHHDIDAAINAAIAAAADDLGVDMIGVSILSANLQLCEIASTEELDPTRYPIVDYPATHAAMARHATLEVQVDDAGADLAERELMTDFGYTSLLVVPVVHGGHAVGIVEFAHRTSRRWSAQDVAHARGLAAHLSPVLRRLGHGTATIAV